MPDRKRTYHGVSIGILMLDTRFERFNGDIGNARTWPFPVQYRIVHDATPNRVTRPEGPDMLDAFKAAADELIAAGVDGITTTCGFLALYQRELAAHCTRAGRDQRAAAGADGGAHPAEGKATGDPHLLGRVPHHPASRGGGRRSGDARPWHAPRLGVPARDPRGRHVGAVRHPAARGARGGRVASVRADASIGALVLECTNLAPYSRDIARLTGLPVFDMVTLVHWFHRSLSPERFAQD